MGDNKRNAIPRAASSAEDSQFRPPIRFALRFV